MAVAASLASALLTVTSRDGRRTQVSFRGFLNLEALLGGGEHRVVSDRANLRGERPADRQIETGLPTRLGELGAVGLALPQEWIPAG